jgi:hypothetical protein
VSTSAPADWAQRDERGSRAALTLMRWLSLGLGRSVSRLVLPFIALYFLLAAPAARRASRAYLARALGRPATWIDVLRHFHAFASTVHDRVFLLNDRFDQFAIEVDPPTVDRACRGAARFSSARISAASRRWSLHAQRCGSGRHYDVTMVVMRTTRPDQRALAALARARCASWTPTSDAMLQVQRR